MALRTGEGLVLTGDHGAGKTSFLRALLGLVGYTGDIHLFGDATPGPSTSTRIGYGPEGKTFLAGLRPVELVATVAAARGVAESHAAHALTRAGMPTAQHRARVHDVEELRRVSLACAIVGDPELLLLDDPWEFTETHAEIAAARERGAAVLVATYDPGGFPALLGRTVELSAGGHA